MSAHYVTTGVTLAKCSCGWVKDGRTVAGAREAAAEHESAVMGTLLARRADQSFSRTFEDLLNDLQELGYPEQSNGGK